MEQCSKRLILQKQRQRVKMVNIIQGVKLIIFSKGHLAPKFFKVVAHSKKLVAIFKDKRDLFYAVSVLERPSKLS